MEISVDGICTVEVISWGNTDNPWKPVRNYTFNSYGDAKVFLNEEKDYRYSYMHKYNVTILMENY